MTNENDIFVGFNENDILEGTQPIKIGKDGKEIKDKNKEKTKEKVVAAPKAKEEPKTTATGKDYEIGTDVDSDPANGTS